MGVLFNQGYEHFGMRAPAPFDRGFLPVSAMPRPPTADAMSESADPGSQVARNGARFGDGRSGVTSLRSPSHAASSRQGSSSAGHRGPPATTAAVSGGRTERKPKSGGGGRARDQVPLRKLHAHVRGKCMPIAVGSAQQFVWWLGAASVQRYLQRHESYVSPYSHELTALRVLAYRAHPADGGDSGVASRPSTAATASVATPGAKGRGRERFDASCGGQSSAFSVLGGGEPVEWTEGGYWEWLDNAQQLGECGLREGDHVWIDVGDGGSVDDKTLSRPFSAKPSQVDAEERTDVPALGLERCGLSYAPDPFAITGEELLMEESAREVDHRPTVQSYRLRQAQERNGAEYEEWAAKRSAAREAAAAAVEGGGEGPAAGSGLTYDDFHAAFENIHLGDLKDSKSWLTEVQGVLWRHYDLLRYVMESHLATHAPSGAALASGGGNGGADNGGKKGGKDAEEGAGGVPVLAMTLLELRLFCRRCALTSPYLSMAQIDLLCPSHNGLRRTSHAAVHHPEGQVPRHMHA